MNGWHKMTNSLLKWHLRRDNNIQLHKFLSKHKTNSEIIKRDVCVGDHKYFYMKFFLNNDSYVTVELLHGDVKSYSIADCFNVIDYKFGNV